MTLTELGSPEDLKSFLSDHAMCLVTFSAHWCGPCRSSKPQLEVVATKESSSIPFGYCYESDLGDYLHTFQIRAFPTYVLFHNTKEVERIQGVNFAGIQQMIRKHTSASVSASSAMPDTGGHSLGGGGGGGGATTSSSHVSPEEARRLRLERLTATTASANNETSKQKEQQQEATTTTTTTPMETEEEEDTAAAAAKKEDVTMEEEEEEEEEETPASPVDPLDPQAIQTLTESMGFSLIRAQKGLLYSTNQTVESAVEWLMEHQDDVDIDEPIIHTSTSTTTPKAQSYKCNDCGKILSNMANLELHANQTGHADFEESTTLLQPLTAEEKAAKLETIKRLLKAKRKERQEAEKEAEKELEKQRRFMGKEMAKTKEQMEIEQRKREAFMRKKEKQDVKRERERIRAELEKDKRERMANKGVLKSRLGVDGYAPDAIQYNDKEQPSFQEETTSAPSPTKKAASASTTASVEKIDDYIQKVSSYRAGGDGGKCLKILKAYIGNVADHPTEDKYQSINMENKAFKTKIKPFIGAKLVLLAVGFAPKEGDATQLVWKPSDNHHLQVLKDTKQKLIKAIAAFG